MTIPLLAHHLPTKPFLMSRLLLVVVVLLLCLNLSQSAEEVPVPVWSDEFTDSGNTDNSIWTARTGQTGWGNFELQNYTKDNARVINGHLEIVVERIQDSFDNTTQFTSARIDTADKVEVQYGTIAAKVWIPNVVAGLWPAFWTLGHDFVDGVLWPRCGEMNIMEMGQGVAISQGLGNQRVVSAAHWEHNETYATYAGHHDFPNDLHYYRGGGSYHIFSLDWTPDSITTYVNDTQVWKMDIDNSTCFDCEEFHKPHFLILNVAVGGGFTSGSASSSGGGGSSCAGSSSAGGSSGAPCGKLRTSKDITAPLPATMRVDWVRIYDNGHVILTSTGGSEAKVDETNAPTKAPTKSPTVAPTKAPTPSPTKDPTPSPTMSPTVKLALIDTTRSPTTDSPTQAPTKTPPFSPTEAPTLPEVASIVATPSPTRLSTTRSPTRSPTLAPTRLVEETSSGGGGSRGCSSKSGKGGKGSGSKSSKSGKGSCKGSSKGSSKSGKGGSSKGSSRTSTEDSLEFSGGTNTRPSSVTVLMAAILAIRLSGLALD